MVRLQADKTEHLRHILLYEFNKGLKASEAVRNIRAVYGDEAVTERTAQRWFTQFETDNFNLLDAPRSGRPSKFDEERLSELIRENPNQSSRALARKMGCNNTTVTRHLQLMRSGRQRPSLRTPVSVSKYIKKQESISPLIPRSPHQKQPSNAFLYHPIKLDNLQVPIGKCEPESAIGTNRGNSDQQEFYNDIDTAVASSSNNYQAVNLSSAADDQYEINEMLKRYSF